MVPHYAERSRRLYPRHCGIPDRISREIRINLNVRFSGKIGF
jgi:hypothetical protein